MRSSTRTLLAIAFGALLATSSTRPAAATDPTVLPAAVPTITMNRGSGYFGDTPMGMGYHPGFNQYYGAIGGNPGFSGFVWSAAGNLLQTLTPINVDVRGVNYNPNTNSIEVVTYGANFGGGPYGLFAMGLGPSGLYTGSNSQVLTSLPGLASDQTMPAYDAVRNRLYSRSTNGIVNIVDRATGGFMGMVALDLVAPGSPVLLGEALGYDGNFDVFITVDLTNFRALVHRLDGSFIGACTVPPFSPTQDRFNMGYSNGQIFVFDTPSNSWHGYQVLGSGNGPPDCSNAAPSISRLWPPNHRMVDVDIHGVTDPDGDPITISIASITQDEPVDGLGRSDESNDDLVMSSTTRSDKDAPIHGFGDGDAAPDGGGIGTSIASIRAERSGLGNGRVYHIHFLASDGQGGQSAGVVTVCVPHDQGQGSNCVDDGEKYDSVTGDALPTAAAPLPSGAGYTRIDTSLPRTRWGTDGVMGGSDSQSRSNPAGPGAVPSLDVNATCGEIQYSLKAESDVLLSIYDITGRRISILEHSRQSAGSHQINWNASGLSPGMYFCRLRAGQDALSRSVWVHK